MKLESWEGTTVPDVLGQSAVSAHLEMPLKFR